MIKIFLFGNNFFMKRKLQTISSVRENLLKIKGQDVKMEVCLGRKKMVNFDAVLKNIYPSVFTVDMKDGEHTEKSYSYTEILCGNVKVVPKNII